MSVVGKKLFYLSKHIVKVAVKVSVFITVFFIIPHWMVHIAVMREVLVSPVNYRIVKPYLYSFCPKSFQELPYKVSFARSIHRGKVSKFTVIEAETVMVFSSKDCIFHPCFFGKPCPFFRVIVFSIKLIKVRIILFFRYFIYASNPLTSGRNSI